MADSSFSLYIQHGGELLQAGGSIPHYCGGQICMKHSLDMDRFGFLDLVDIVENLGYASWRALGYKIPGEDMEIKFLSGDADVMDMLKMVKPDKRMILLYVDSGKKSYEVDEEGQVEKDQPETDNIGSDANSEGTEEEWTSEDLSDGEVGVVPEKENRVHGVGEEDRMSLDSDDEEDPDYHPTEENQVDNSDTDDGLEDDELASDDEEYIKARKDKVKYKNYVHVEDPRRPSLAGSSLAVFEERVDEDVNEDQSGFVSEYEESDGDVNSDSSSEEDVNTVDEGRKRRKRSVRYDPRCDHTKFEFTLNMRFESAHQCRNAIIRYSVAQGLPLKFIRSNQKQVEVHCREPDCVWKLYGSMWGHTFLVKTLVGPHTCHRVMDNKIATSAWIAKEFVHKWRQKPSFSAADLKEEVLDKLSLELSMIKCYRARWKALELLRGSVFEHYSYVRSYIAELKRVDPTGRFELLLNDNGCLRGFFVGFTGLMKGFVKGCRPVVGFDGCFLKTVLGGALLAAVGKDGNNQMYPICWAVVEAENEEMWTWFMTIMFEELRIRDGLGWTFISDQQKGLLNAIQNLTPHADIRNCARHVYCNWKKDFKGQALKNLFWGAVRSAYKADYLSYLEEMKKFNEPAYHNFLERDLTKWGKSFVSTLPKSDIVDNNVCETFNGYIVKSRSKHLIDMCEDIRTALMARQHDKLQSMSGVLDKICPLIRKKLERNEYNGRLCSVKPAIGGKFQVSISADQFIVDLGQWTCTCRVWDINGIPCMHACACIRFMKKDTADFVSHHFSVNKYIEAYSHALEPINGRKMWPQSEGNPVKPPPYRKMPGRPKKPRKRAPEEDPKNPHRVTRHGIEMTCRSCGEKGHNKRSCKNPPKNIQQVKRKRGRPRKGSMNNEVAQSQPQGASKETVKNQDKVGSKRPMTRSYTAESTRTASRKKKKYSEGSASKDSNRARELRNARKGYGAYCSASGEIYFKNPGSRKVINVSGSIATKQATTNTAHPPPKVPLASASEGPSYAKSTVSSRARSSPTTSRSSLRVPTKGIKFTTASTQESTVGK